MQVITAFMFDFKYTKTSSSCHFFPSYVAVSLILKLASICESLGE